MALLPALLPALLAGLLAGPLAALQAPLRSDTASPGAAAPNFLVVVIDDASWEEFTALPLTHIAALSASGRVYQRFYTSPVCSPSRYQLHFGRLPHDALIGKALVANTDAGAATTERSLAEALGAAGYRTALFGKWHVNGKQLPIELREAPRVHGFDTWRAGSIENVGLSASHYQWSRIDDGVLSTETTYSSVAIAGALIDWWQATPEPRFGVCSFLAPHAPFELPPAELLGGYPQLTTPRWKYQAALVALDTLIGQLVQTLDLTDTYLFLLPDNGTPGEVSPPAGQSPGYKATPYEGGIHVPLIVVGPGVAPGADHSLVQVVDLPRTILELARAPLGIGFEDSRSFARTLVGLPGEREWMFVQRFSPNGGPAAALTQHDWAVQRDDGWKLLLRDGGAPELYHLPSDPWETTPVQDPAIESSLLQLRDQVLGPDWPY
jgi:arylsulfatase B